MLTPQEKAALDVAARAARGAELETGCPAAVTVAQWALESGWGLHQPGNNCFGIKAKPGEKFQQLSTKEVIHGETITIIQKFRIYDSLQEAFEEHGKLLTEGAGYRDAFARYQRDGDLNALIGAIAQEYATAPNYGDRLKAVLAMKDVQDALALNVVQDQPDKREA